MNRYEKDKIMLLDRENGFITINTGVFSRREYKILFSELKVYWRHPNVHGGESSIKMFIDPPRLKTESKMYLRTSLSLHTGFFGSDWSFMVWYMDKNRPLPPGEAFDAYREKDYERRKAEGFPPPLYPTRFFPTPEATPEQNAERRKYWKDEDYYQDTDSKWY